MAAWANAQPMNDVPAPVVAPAQIRVDEQRRVESQSAAHLESRSRAGDLSVVLVLADRQELIANGGIAVEGSPPPVGHVALAEQHLEVRPTKPLFGTSRRRPNFFDRLA